MTTSTQPEQRRILATAIPGPLSLERQAQRKAELANGLGTTMPVFVDRAGGGILVDVDGNHIIDLASGIAVTSVGAAHPAVTRRIAEQAARFTHTCFLVTEYDGFVDVAAALNRLTPGDHAKKTALFSTGAEAVENAIKIARTATGRPAVVVLGHAYHGRTNLTMAMTAKNVPYKQGFGPLAPEVYRVPSPYPYRWPSGPERAAEEAFAALKDIVTIQVGATNVAAIVVEPIQGEGGFIVPPPGYLKAVQELATEHGIVFVADEIQTGLGRTGAMFACEHEGVVPDLVTTAKALAGGMPLAAVTGRAEIMDAVAAGGLGGTYAGNPVACAAALGALEAIESEGLVARAREIEERVLPRLAELVVAGSVVGEVRGRGAMLALELVEPGTTQPAPAIAKAVVERCHEQGVLTLQCGTYGNVIRLLPPLVIPFDLLDEAIDVLVDAIRGVR
ncbi:4-aminobutyrate--2-oxoglutarate transaminase [Nocardioides kongjuensis]|uniref:(S)-3-amino-2-methylpropionate transaminase n=1 Tax=Nocardioides kongjuensis TaxID=349522 RepID=A0A852RAP7_9ACTN|nr:4-aminobutyrate--2-oxoglutarate transaminase [Nocardioides kongjuensis]NYD30671.1 4-aminobutyrate aminotransferase/(S)-3-amino-2-methylpropionate transaminase [Nocardioides kongjuensis]